MDNGQRDFSAKAREEWIRKEEQAHEAVRAMLRRLDEKDRDAKTSPEPQPLPLGRTTSGGRSSERLACIAEEGEQVEVRRRVVKAGGVDGIRRNRRMGKFVEHLPSEEEVEEMEREEEQAEVVATPEEKADWRLSRVGPKILTFERAPWEEDDADVSNPEDDEEERQPSPVHVEPPPINIDRKESHVWLEDIDEETEDDSSTAQSPPASRGSDMTPITRPKLYTPPAEYSRPFPPPSPVATYPIYKLPADIFPAPPTPRSPNFPLSPVSDLHIPTHARTPPKSPSNLRTRAGLKKIFLSIRPRKRDDEPLSPTPTLSSSCATTPSLPTPTIRITSPFHPRRFDGSLITEEHPTMGRLSPTENGGNYRLPELRLSRADWGEWGRQVADRL
jgi:hypothetical protein